MPSLLPRAGRRKRITPLVNLADDDVWERTFRQLGLEPLQASLLRAEYQRSCTAMAADAASTTGAAALRPPLRQTRGFTDLPIETQREVFKFVSTSDLVSLSLVSKYFRDLAASQLYRNFHIVFPDDDDPTYDHPIDGLAAGLDTFVTSEYDYARYLKSIMLDTLDAGEKGERVYKPYSAEVSCGKFMNTLFLLTIRKARALETFRWDLRIEISRPLFKALHSLPVLQNFHLRMHDGHSLYETPPPLHSLKAGEAPKPLASWAAPLHPPPSYGFHPASTLKPAPKPKSRNGKGKDTERDKVGVPPTLSGFKNLKSLAVLDMDNLDYINEIKACIRNSSFTLQKLQLSFSEKFAQSSRKPIQPRDQVEVDPDASDDEGVDEFGNTVPLPPQVILSSGDESLNGPSKALRAKEERIAQEAVLGRVFGIEPLTLMKGADEAEEAQSDEDESSDKASEEEKETNDPNKQWVKDLLHLTKKWTKAANHGVHHISSNAAKDALDLIEKAARKYVDSTKADEKKAETSGEGSGSSNVKSSATKGGDDATSDANAESAASSSETVATESKEREKLSGTAKSEDATKSTMFDKPTKSRTKPSNPADGPAPEDIDVNAPELEADPKDFEDIAAEEIQQDKSEEEAEASKEEEDITVKMNRQSSELTAVRLRNLNLMKQNHELLREQMFLSEAEVIKISARIQELSSSPGTANPVILEVLRGKVRDLKKAMQVTSEQLSHVNFDVEDFQRRLLEPKNGSQAMEEYIRQSRGLQLKSFAIYLIPLRASVLTKVLDLHVLEEITLLNVGPQDKLWTAMSALNTEAPLPLKRIFSDSVTLVLLNFINSLSTVEDLFLMEGREKTDLREVRRIDKQRMRATPAAPRTTVTMEMIRKIVLKKHMSTLKRLVINNWDGNSWDANEVVVKLICRKGRKLEELALSMGPRATHTFNQYLPSLTSLRAMHILLFRNDDNCPWVSREVRKFAVDCVAAHPNMKLEYIALGSTVERLVRRPRKLKPKSQKPKVDIKGKGKEVSGSAPISAANPFDLVNLEQLMWHGKKKVEESSSEESEDDDDDDGQNPHSWAGDKGPGMRLETLEGLGFFDISGVRIWEKDVVGGWL